MSVRRGHLRPVTLTRRRSRRVGSSGRVPNGSVGGESLRDLAFVDEAHLVGDLTDEALLLVGAQHRHALRLEIAHDVEDLADEPGIRGPR